MENLLNVSPGLMIWTFVNFLIFLFLIGKFAVKPIMKGLQKREDGINDSIEAARAANAKAQETLRESINKLDQAQSQMASIVAKGRDQADAFIRKATEEAEAMKRRKVEEAAREIEQNKELALKQLRSEVANLVVSAAELILESKLDKEKDFKLIEDSIDKLPKN